MHSRPEGVESSNISFVCDSDEYNIAEVDMAMNSDLPWSQAASGATTGDSMSYDVQNIATHEAGHWLMLGDLYTRPATEQTVYGYGAKGELKKRSLESGDIAGVRAIYPNP